MGNIFLYIIVPEKKLVIYILSNISLLRFLNSLNYLQDDKSFNI